MTDCVWRFNAIGQKEDELSKNDSFCDENMLKRLDMRRNFPYNYFGWVNRTYQRFQK